MLLTTAGISVIYIYIISRHRTPAGVRASSINRIRVEPESPQCKTEAKFLLQKTRFSKPLGMLNILFQRVMVQIGVLTAVLRTVRNTCERTTTVGEKDGWTFYQNEVVIALVGQCETNLSLLTSRVSFLVEHFDAQIESKNPPKKFAERHASSDTISLRSVTPAELTKSPRLNIMVDAINFLVFVSKVDEPNIVLIRQPEVVQWMFGDLSFLPAFEHTTKTADRDKNKVLEDRWGQGMLKLRRPDLKLDKQWSNKFGEHICEEIYTLLGKVVSKPAIKEHYQPDFEIDNAIVEAKTQTFYTAGTAGEKILGCPFKYAEIPYLYGKPLKILCIGGAEMVCLTKYGNLPGARNSPQKQKFLDFFRDNGIEYIGATDILRTFGS